MDVFDTVFSSSVRQAVLRELSERPRQRRDLLDDVDASKSAVYNALNELRDHDLLREGRTRRWETTGLGEVVADYVAARDRTGDVLSAHADYWASHDPSALPDPFRSSLGALAGADRLGSPDTEPFRVGSHVVDVIEHADRVALCTPIDHHRYRGALERIAGDADVRLVLSAPVVREVDERTDANWDDDAADVRHDAADVRHDAADVRHDAADVRHDAPDVRLAEPGCTLLVTDDAVLLALPHEDGTHDPEEKLLARSERALDWGERFFEHVWRDATPLSSVESAPQQP
jgi:predicted transcriptional regulator